MVFPIGSWHRQQFFSGRSLGYYHRIGLIKRGIPITADQFKIKHFKKVESTKYTLAAKNLFILISSLKLLFPFNTGKIFNFRKLSLQ
jgi:hypothetical protein